MMCYVGLLAGLTAIALLTWKLIDLLFPWFKYDLKYLSLIIGCVFVIKKAERRRPVYTLIDKLIERAADSPTKPFVYFEDKIWTYQVMNEFANKIARVMWEGDIRLNSTVALIMRPRPEFIGIWFGIGKTCGTTAFINYNLRNKGLLHCLDVSKCKAIVVESESDLLQAVSDIKDELKSRGIVIYTYGDIQKTVDFEHKSLDKLLESQQGSEVPTEWRDKLTIKSHFCYVYTSGTTGLPKAALIQHDRAFLTSRCLPMAGLKSSDTLYSPLPLYHTTSGTVGTLGALSAGCSIVIRKKFSASQMWPDCRKYKATFVQYIGETMRYVCNTPPHPDDKNHSVRIVFGNGLRPRVWKQFLERFGQQIKVEEVYAATEGNAAFFNLDNHFGSVGQLSPFIKALGLVTLIQYDKENDEVYRNKSGWCVEVPYGTPGLLVSKITKSTPFQGYMGEKANTEKKILRNVFKDGDMYLNTGDMLRRDPDYHMYFVDRIGDTFRWKGENISTNEVGDLITEAPGIKEANAYGVTVPENEGRAGMVVVLLEEGVEFDAAAVYEYANSNLTLHACPRFLRIRKELELTGTFKQKKYRLVEEGFDPQNMKDDPIYFLDQDNKTYSVLTLEIYDDIVEGKIRL